MRNEQSKELSDGKPDQLHGTGGQSVSFQLGKYALIVAALLASAQNNHSNIPESLLDLPPASASPLMDPTPPITTSPVTSHSTIPRKEKDTKVVVTSDGMWTITIRKGFKREGRYRQGV